MLSVNPQYITDSTGKKISVVLTMKDFKAIMEELEGLTDVKLYDEAKESNEPSIPIDDALKSIPKEEMQNPMELAVNELYVDYVNDKELTAFTSLDFETFYETK